MAFNDDNKIPDMVPSPSTIEPVLVDNDGVTINMTLQPFGIFGDIATGKVYQTKWSEKGKAVSATLKQIIADGMIEEIGGSAAGAAAPTVNSGPVTQLLQHGSNSLHVAQTLSSDEAETDEPTQEAVAENKNKKDA